MRQFSLLAMLVVLAGCASAPPDQPVPERVEYDPWEPLNRSSYAVSDAFDRVTLKPIAKGYRKVIPRFIRSGVSNFSDNILTPRSIVNNILQGKPRRGMSDLTRLLVNSTLGIGGLIDIASRAGLEEADETFAQTLAVWGVPDGPYVYVPFFGPHTVSAAIARPIDILSDPLFHYDNASVADKLIVLQAIDLRARLLNAESFIEDSKDPYVTIRESYLQNRQFRIYDGDPPNEDEDLFEEFLNEE